MVRRADLISTRTDLATKKTSLPFERHCEERKRRSNPAVARGVLDCFACARNDFEKHLRIPAARKVCPELRRHSTRRLSDQRMQGSDRGLAALHGNEQIYR